MEINDLLPCALQVVARIAIPPAKLRKIIGSGQKQLNAYNLCDGFNSVTEISKKSRLDQGNLSRTLARWREHGIVFLVGSGHEARYLRIYPIPKKDLPD